MQIPDVINGLFQLAGAFSNAANVVQLFNDKKVRGVKIFPTAVFVAWGFWNIFYYSYLDQTFSFLCGIFMMVVNTIWVLLAVYYSHRERRDRIKV